MPYEIRMSPAASFSKRWARDNLTRVPSDDELKILEIFPWTCGGDEGEAARRARKYYRARGPGGLSDLWHNRQPDGEDILSSCQDAYIVPLRTKTVGDRRLTMIRLPAPTAMDRPISARALLARWLMILDIRLREDPSPCEEVVFIDVSDLQPMHLKSHFRKSYWKDFYTCMKTAYPRRFAEVHVINARHLKTIPLLLLHIGLYPWKKQRVHVHGTVGDINHAMGVDYFPIENLPFEYGGRAGAMKDLNDEWTKKLLLNSKWLQSEERKFYETELKPEMRTRTRHKSAVRTLGGNNESYDMLSRTHSCRSLNKIEDIDEGPYGAYRTLQLTSDGGFYV
ncbi:uncharacterized protein LOC128679331 isoform X1 [Plodia interpunctella]|uniref:uncharacterized protein LOC128679331 isoform X1 n=2 Tax=Plodia interpunctella TaxID=58824 RepID=UPI0023685BCA|nr:uncharacterized protein LOC128679331 isoform X1 [Plodia interpunctella]